MREVHAGIVAAGVALLLVLPACSKESVTCSPSGTSLKIAVEKSHSHQFNTDCLAAPAGQPFSIEFVNDDPSPHGIHNVEIMDGDARLFTGDNIRGGESVTYEIGALPAGTYQFRCTNHFYEGMIGTFIVE